MPEGKAEGASWPGRRWGTEEASLYLLAFVMQLGMGILAPVLPDIQATFAVTAAQVGLAIAAFGLARLVLDLPVGMLLGRVRPLWLFAVGSLTIALGGLLGSFAVTFPLVIAARALMGAGSAFYLMCAQYRVGQLSTDANRGRLLGNFQAAMLAGASFSPAIGGAVAVAFGWRASFAFGAITAFAGLVTVLLTQRGSTARVAAPKPAAGRERAAEPGLDRRGWMTVLTANLVTALLMVHIGGFQNVVVPLIGGIRVGLDAATIGLAVGLSSFLRFGTSILGGRLADRYGRRWVLIPGLLIVGAGVLGFNYVTTLGGYLAAMLFMSLGRFGNSIPTTVIMDQTPRRTWGRAIGLNRFTGDFGVVLGPLALGWLVDHYGFAAAVYAMAAAVWAVTLLAAVAIREAPRGRLSVPSDDED